MSELTDDPFQAARLILTLRQEGITDPDVLRAIETVPRSMFIEPDLVDLAYDCLLYTSPSPRDQRGSRMPSSA